MTKEDLMLFLFFFFGISFVVFMNVHWHYIVRLNSLLKRKYLKLHKKLILIDFGYALFIPRPIRLFKYFWFEKSHNEDVAVLVKKIRYFLKLGILFFILMVISPFFAELIYWVVT